MNIVEEIFSPYINDAQSSVILTGRNIYDYECDGATIGTIVSMMAAYAKAIDMCMVRYSLAAGMAVPYHMYQKVDSATIKSALSSSNITGQTGCQNGNCSASQELVTVLRGIQKLTSSSPVFWSNGQPIKWLFLFDFTSDIMPESNNTNQLIARELVYQLVLSQQFRNNGNLLILSDVVEGRIDNQIKDLIVNKYLPYPDYDAKLSFLRALHQQYPKATYVEGLDDTIVANLCSSMPNRSTVGIFEASHKTGKRISSDQIVSKKIQDVQAISEGTVTMLQTDRVKNLQLVGASICVPMQFLQQQANKMRYRDASALQNILLVGAPGTAKTSMALRFALETGLPMYQLASPKASLVGETERRAQLQAKILETSTPIVAFIDEITESIPSQRVNNYDSGASDAVLQALLTTLSNDTLAGKSIVLATSNCPNKMIAAMLDRFVIVPVLMPSVEDLPFIIGSICQQLGATIDIYHPCIVQAADIFYAKHLMARRIRSAIKLQLQFNEGQLSPDGILDAAFNATPLDEKSWLNSVYADLSALSMTVSKRLYPWYGHEKSYPYPDYIKKVLTDNYEINPEKLSAELKAIEPYVNI